ncbi:MAG: hypothetical protein LBM62_00015 [Mediterranea sp.]|jgi:hypothetical protein|nr:hypothetical protein [Mediterranea sp.]
MEYNGIEQLLERYWQGETSPEEEALLRDFFSGDAVPKHLLRYKDWFAYQLLQQAELGEDFDERVLAQIETPVVKAKRVRLTGRFFPLLKAAAVVTLMLVIGNMVERSSFRPLTEVVATDTIGRQISTPSVAISVEAPLGGQQLPDSVKRMEEQKEIIKR